MKDSGKPTEQDPNRSDLSARILVAAHYILATLTYSSHALGRIFKRSPILLVENGLPVPRNMRRARVTEHDLKEGLRLRKGVDDLALVRAAYLERNGEISVVLRSEPA